MVKKRGNIKIRQEILHTLMILIVIMTVLIAGISLFVNIQSESKSLDSNLQNIARTVAQSEIVKRELISDSADISQSAAYSYMDSLKNSLSNIDVISVIGADGIRKYHSNKQLVGTVYDGTVPDIQSIQGVYVTSDTGPSGSQRRAYAAIYDDDGNYLGFVLAVMLNKSIYMIIMYTVLIHLFCAAAVIALACAMSKHLSNRIKKMLSGYEPDVFSAMFSIRDNILESLEEGIAAIDADEQVIYMNNPAKHMLCTDEKSCAVSDISASAVKKALKTGEKTTGIDINTKNGAEILADIIPIIENESVIGTLCILRDRTEYTKMMEDLSGVKYLVESMRANNHDFTNKLHVILGLIQMGNTKEACDYITGITSIQQAVLHNIIKNIDDPSLAALLIGKYSRAAELNIRFALKSGSSLSRSDISLPSGDLVTIVGNLLDNAMDSMNMGGLDEKSLSVGIYTQPHAMIISVDDTGIGIKPENCGRIFENGFSSKGEGRGTGLYIVKGLIDKYSGTIAVDSEPGVGTSFTVTLTDEGGTDNV